TTALVFIWLRCATGAIFRSFVVAALFGVHPLHVESVAWVAERKDVLSGLFWFAGMYSYVEYARRSRPRTRPARLFYCFSVICFLLGLMSKPMVVTFPLVLLLMDYWPLGRFGNNKVEPTPQATALVKEKWPFLLPAVASAVVTLLVQRSGGAMEAE